MVIRIPPLFLEVAAQPIMEVLLGAVTVVLAAIVVLIGGLIFHLAQSHGRLLLHTAELERRIAEQVAKPAQDEALPAPLAVGTVAPDFELADLSGGTMTLSQWRGQRVLLIFLSPDCDHSLALLPALAALPRTPSEGQPVPLIVTTSDVAKIGHLRDRYGLRNPVLLQEDWEAGAFYRAVGTPAGYLIDERGIIASELVAGTDSLIALLGWSALIKGPAPIQFGRGQTTPRPFKFWPDKPNAQPWPEEPSLRASDTAPDFRLPRVGGGGEIALADYRGRPVLLVFSDPACGPCHDLAPELEQYHRTTPDVQIVMVSRRDSEANLAMMAQYGLTFPVVLQSHLDLSRAYGSLAVPLAYLIDGRGVIAENAAIGAEAILALASKAAEPSGPRKEVPIGR